MKFSLIATEAYRMNSCSTNKIDLKKALSKLENKFVRHNFPRSQARAKIASIV